MTTRDASFLVTTWGHRAARHDGKGQLSSRLRNNQRKDSQFKRPIHPDAQASYDDLVEFNAEAVRDILADLEEEKED